VPGITNDPEGGGERKKCQRGHLPLEFPHLCAKKLGMHQLGLKDGAIVSHRNSRRIFAISFKEFLGMVDLNFCLKICP